MAYGWAAWKNRDKLRKANGSSRTPFAKERAYLRGYYEAAKEHGISHEGAVCPGHVLDDPGIDAGGAHELGCWDAREAARNRRVRA